MPNLKFVEDKTFEMLSVTAHKWVPIKEVGPYNHHFIYVLDRPLFMYSNIGGRFCKSIKMA